MKIFRLLAASLLVAVCAGFSSCGDDELEEHQTEVMFIDGDSFSTYGLNFRDYECYGSFHWGNINHFSGLKNNHLWISSYDRTTKENIIRKTKCSAFLERSVHFSKTKCSFPRAPESPTLPFFPRLFIPQIIAKNFGHLTKNNYFCIV